MSDFTPGPWAFVASEPKDVRLKRDHWQIGNAETRAGVALAFGDTDANARLIACARELPAMVQRYASECACCEGHGITPTNQECPLGEPCPECADIRALISKATCK